MAGGFEKAADGVERAFDAGGAAFLAEDPLAALRELVRALQRGDYGPLTSELWSYGSRFYERSGAAKKRFQAALARVGLADRDD